MRSPLRTALLYGLFLLLSGLGPAWGALSPKGEVIQILGPTCTEDWLDVAVLPGGDFLAIWTDTSTSWIDPDVRVLAQRFGADGTPLSEALELAMDARIERTRIAANAEGRVLIAWYDKATGAVVIRFFDQDLVPQGESRILSQAVLPLQGLDVAVLANGGFAVAAARPHPVLWRFGPVGEELDVTQLLPEGAPVQGLDNLRLSALGEEGAAAVWSLDDAGVLSVQARFFQPGGAFPLVTVAPPFTDNLPLSLQTLPPPQPSIAGDRAGNVLVTWRGTIEDPLFPKPALLARGFGPDGMPLTGAFRLDGTGETPQSAPDVVADGAGGFITVWQTRLESTPRSYRLSLQRRSAWGQVLEPMLRVPYDLPTFEQPVAVLDAAGNGHLVVARQGSIEHGIPEEVCARTAGLFAWSFDAAPAGLLLQERFRVEVRWAEASDEGNGRPVVLTPDSGYFWFFGPDNVELMLKVLDGRSLNGHFWVFYASLSNVAYTITVTDTETGRVKTYQNASGQLASRGDTAAFPADGTSVAAPGSLVPVGPSSGLLLGDRFEVEVAWTDPATGISGIGYGAQLTDDSGYLWFFGPNNIELVIKVLDGRAVNGRYWVFYGALSNVAYTIRVRDTATGQVREYRNPAGQLRSHADTSAFPLPG